MDTLKRFAHDRFTLRRKPLTRAGAASRAWVGAGDAQPAGSRRRLERAAAVALAATEGRRD